MSAERLEAIDRLARSTARLVQTQQELIEEMRRDLADTRAELRQVKATAYGAQYLAGAALSDD